MTDSLYLEVPFERPLPKAVAGLVAGRVLEETAMVCLFPTKSHMTAFAVSVFPDLQKPGTAVFVRAARPGRDGGEVRFNEKGKVKATNCPVDIVIEVSYTSGEKHGKKVLLLEVKSGSNGVSHKQRRYIAKALGDPTTALRKAEEAKVFLIQASAWVISSGGGGKATYTIKNLVIEPKAARPQKVEVAEPLIPW